MPCSKGVINKTCPSRDSTRIVKHTFDGAKIGIISESSKYFERNSSFPRYFQTFRLFLSFFPIYFLLLQMNMGKCLSGGACATFVGKTIASAIYSENLETSEISMMYYFE